MPFVQSKLLQQENVCSHTFTMQFCFTQDTFTFLCIGQLSGLTGQRWVENKNENVSYALHTFPFSSAFSSALYS